MMMMMMMMMTIDSSSSRHLTQLSLPQLSTCSNDGCMLQNTVSTLLKTSRTAFTAAVIYKFE